MQSCKTVFSSFSVSFLLSYVYFFCAVLIILSKWTRLQNSDTGQKTIQWGDLVSISQACFRRQWGAGAGHYLACGACSIEWTWLWYWRPSPPRWDPGWPAAPPHLDSRRPCGERRAARKQTKSRTQYRVALQRHGDLGGREGREGRREWSQSILIVSLVPRLKIQTLASVHSFL